MKLGDFFTIWNGGFAICYNHLKIETTHLTFEMFTCESDLLSSQEPSPLIVHVSFSINACFQLNEKIPNVNLLKNKF